MFNLLENPDFLRDVHRNLTSQRLLERYAPKLSLRRVQEIAKQARELLGEPSLQEPEWAKAPMVAKSFKFPQSTEPKQTNWPVIYGDFGLISDLHIPYHDAGALEFFCNTCDALKIKRFVIIGDTMDGNQWHPKRGTDQHHSRRWQEDAELTEKIFGVLLECFDSGLVLQGNHDAWFTTHLRGQVGASWHMSRIFHKVADRIEYSDFEQATAISGEKEFRLAHGANYSAANPLGVAQKLADKFDCGVVMGHQHMSATGWSTSGKHQCVCLGGVYDSNRFGYIHNSPKVGPTMTRSFGILKEGYVKNYEVNL